jgi:hypothetical protein
MWAYSQSDRPHGTTCSSLIDTREVVPDNRQRSACGGVDPRVERVSAYVAFAPVDPAAVATIRPRNGRKLPWTERELLKV